MKKTLLLALLFATFLSAKAQINYSFTATSGSYTPITGTSVNLVTAFAPTKTTLDEGYANAVPIGFTFQYNGLNYNNIHLNTNGFASLGAPFLSSSNDPRYEQNELRNASGLKATIRPILAPFWDNLLLNAAADLSYATSGTAPNRVFTAQWSNAIWHSGTAAISFQLKLYETTGLVEFVYKPEAGAIPLAASASIGISNEQTNVAAWEDETPYFLSLNAATSAATASSTAETETINTKPTDGQVFRFTPLACMPPAGIKLSTFSTNAATLGWTPTQGAPGYETVLSNIDVVPTTGSFTTITAQTFSNLAPNTEYFFFIKNTCGSAWTRFKFKTSVLATLPYNENFESGLDGALPTSMNSQNLSNTFADMQWQTTKLLASPTGATGTAKAVNSSQFGSNNTWLFTPSFNLLGGGTYQLVYKFSSTAATNSGGRANAAAAIGLNTKYGLGTGEAAMTNTLATDVVSSTSYQTKTISITPATTGEYSIGFQYQADPSDALLLLDEIALTLTSAPLPLNLLSFDAKLDQENLVALQWETTAERGVSHFEIEKSEDAKQFAELGRTNARNLGLEKNTYEYYDRHPAAGINYYRLKMVDLDGQFSYSPIRFVNLKQNFVTSLYPNPSPSQVYLRVQNANGIAVKVYTVDGRPVSVTPKVTSDSEIQLTPTEKLPQGIYLVNVISASETRVLKWMVR
jgi:hypothetical protein